MSGFTLQLPRRACRQWQNDGDERSETPACPPAAKPGVALQLPSGACRQWRVEDEVRSETATPVPSAGQPGLALQLPARACRQWRDEEAGPREPATSVPPAGKPGLALLLPGLACRQWRNEEEAVSEPPKLVPPAGEPGLSVLLPGRACKQWRDEDDEFGQASRDGDDLREHIMRQEIGHPAPKPSSQLHLPSRCFRACDGDKREEGRRPEGPTPTLRGTLLPLLGGSSERDAALSEVPPAPARRCRRLDSRKLIPENLEVAITQRYEIDPRELGAGAYGRVFMATDKTAKQRRVAIKKVVLVDADMRQNFEREVLIMKDLDHPSICKIFESYDHGRTVYLVMEYCAGGELFDRICQQGRLSEEASVGIVRQIASALKYAHGRGIAHRDLKPENVCFCSPDPADDHVKVIDWGVGFCFGRGGLQRMRSNVGSIAYTAPEVLSESGSYTSACDMWSLGVIAYCMLCGDLPFSGDSCDQLRQMTEQPCPMDGPEWEGISEAGKAFIRSLICSDPVKRLHVDDVLSHDWLRLEEEKMADGLVMERILDNMHSFRNSSSFFSLCAVTVARQLDHHSLDELRRAFREMDLNGDGVLQLQEFRDVFARIYGENSPRLHEIEQLFEHLDLDGSGEVDYSEFCAAALGERLRTDADALWAAFKAFDVHDGDGRLSRREIMQALATAEVPDEVCEEVAGEIFERFDGDGDGSLDFHEWSRLMREYEGHSGGQTSTASPSDSSLTEVPSPIDSPVDSPTALAVHQRAVSIEDVSIIAGCFSGVVHGLFKF